MKKQRIIENLAKSLQTMGDITLDLVKNLKKKPQDFEAILKSMVKFEKTSQQLEKATKVFEKSMKKRKSKKTKLKTKSR